MFSLGARRARSSGLGQGGQGHHGGLHSDKSFTLSCISLEGTENDVILYPEMILEINFFDSPLLSDSQTFAVPCHLAKKFLL